MEDKIYEMVIERISKAVIDAGTTFSEDKKAAYKNSIVNENNPQSRWVMEQILNNEETARREKSPLCDDTGIPHIVLDIGDDMIITPEYIDCIYEGVRRGLELLPGRPMGLLGDDIQRIEQAIGISDKSQDVEPAPIMIRRIKGKTKLHILLLGGGPAIRAKTYRIFHKHSINAVENEIVDWAIEGVSKLGCTPCTLAIGIGRSHYEAASYMIQAMVDGRYDIQSELERNITGRVNESKVGALGLGGNTSVLGTFLKVGPQRASGVRIVSIRPCCCFEPRIATIEL